MKVTIDEGTVHLIVAAYRIGKGDAGATPPKDILKRCCRLVEAETEDEANAALKSL